MPELPEVETVRSILEKNILNKTILDINVRYENIIQNETKSDFISKLNCLCVCIKYQLAVFV